MNKQTFDSLSFGAHFQTEDATKFIKVKNVTEWMGWSVWFQDDYGNKNRFNAISYDGVPTNIKWDTEVKTISSLFDDLFGSISKSPLDNLLTCDKIEESKATSNVDDALLKNKQIETTKQMQTYNNLTEAVIAAINELKSAGTLSAYQITTLIRQKTNQGDWAVTGCEARPNNNNIQYWINHDDVRRALNELYANNELAPLGFTGRNYNGTYLEYSFSSTSVDPSVGTTYGSSTTVVNVPTPVPQVTKNPLSEKIEAYVSTRPGSVTLKQVQSALKINGVTCKDIYDILSGLSYPLTPGPTADDYYSQYVVG